MIAWVAVLLLGWAGLDLLTAGLAALGVLSDGA
jgi:hypothetical protein